MDAAAGGLTSDQKNNMKYSTRLKVFYHLNIGKGIMLLVSDRRRTVRLETVREYFHFIKPESPFLNAIVLSPFCRRWRAEHSPGWWYQYVDIVLSSTALRSMYDCEVIASVKNTKLSPQKLAEAHHFFYLPPFLEKQKENCGTQKYFWHWNPHCNSVMIFPLNWLILSLLHSSLQSCAWLQLWHEVGCVISKQQFCRISNKAASISFRTFYLHWLVYEVDHTWEKMEQHWDHVKTSVSMHNTAPGGHSWVLQFVLNVLG